MITDHRDQVGHIVLTGMTKLVDTGHKTSRDFNSPWWQVTMRAIVIIVNTALILGLIVWTWKIGTSI